MTATNETTGDKIQTKPSTCKHREGWTRIWADDAEDAFRDAVEDKRRDDAEELARAMKEQLTNQ